MAIPGNFPDQGELVEFETDDEPKWVTVKLKDGSVIQIKMEIVSIARAGNDMNTGLPLYMVQATNIIRMQKVPKELIAKKKAVEDQRQSMYR